MVLTAPPPAADLEARAIATVEEFIDATRVASAAFANPHIPEQSDSELAGEYERTQEVLFAAWVDGRIAASGRATFTPAARTSPAVRRRRGRAARRLPRGGARALGRCGRAWDAGARGRRGPDVEADPRTARLRAGPRVPSARVRTLLCMSMRLEELEQSGLDVPVVLAWLVSGDVGIPDDELNAARRRAMLVLAAGGDPHREIDLGSVAAARLADELDTPERRGALAAALDALAGEAEGLPAVEVALHLPGPTRTWRGGTWPSRSWPTN